MEFARIWLPLLAIVINALLAWAVWSVKRGLVSKDEHHALVRRVDADKAEIDRVGNTVRDLPTVREMGAIREELAALRSSVDGVVSAVERIENKPSKGVR